MFDKRILWNGNWVVRLYQIEERFVGEIEVESVRVVEVILPYVHLCLVDVWMKPVVLL